jgi:hypothetical protein
MGIIRWFYSGYLVVLLTPPSYMYQTLASMECVLDVQRQEVIRQSSLDVTVKRYKPEQIVTLLRQIDAGIANGRPPAGLQGS